MDPTPLDRIPAHHQRIMELISYVGSSLSIIGLFVTVLLYAFFRYSFRLGRRLNQRCQSNEFEILHKEPAEGSRREDPAEPKRVAATAQRDLPDRLLSGQRHRDVNDIGSRNDTSVDGRYQRRQRCQSLRWLVRRSGRRGPLFPADVHVLDAGGSRPHVPVADHRLRQQRNVFHDQTLSGCVGSVTFESPKTLMESRTHFLSSLSLFELKGLRWLLWCLRRWATWTTTTTLPPKAVAWPRATRPSTTLPWSVSWNAEDAPESRRMSVSSGRGRRCLRECWSNSKESRRCWFDIVTRSGVSDPDHQHGRLLHGAEGDPAAGQTRPRRRKGRVRNRRGFRIGKATAFQFRIWVVWLIEAGLRFHDHLFFLCAVDDAGIDGTGTRCCDAYGAAGGHVVVRSSGHWSAQSGAAVRLLRVQLAPGFRHLLGARRPVSGSADVAADAVDHRRHSHPLHPFVEPQSRGELIIDYSIFESLVNEWPSLCDFRGGPAPKVHPHGHVIPVRPAYARRILPAAVPEAGAFQSVSSAMTLPTHPFPLPSDNANWIYIIHRTS